MPKPIAEQLAEFILNTDYKSLPQEAVEMAKLCFLDWLGSTYAGSKQRPTRIFLELARELGGRPEATLIPDGSKSSCLFAAMVNAASSHVMEMDDLHKASILHPAAAVIPAALATAEREGSSGAELIAAIVAGYEVAIRIGEAVGSSHYQYWHTTGTCGTFGAAAAAGKLLGLGKEEQVWALGSAGTQASGLWEFLVEGAMSKQLHPAKAAGNGLLSALLAQKGFTAASRILEGEKGFCRATAKDFDLVKVTEGLGKGEYRILSTSFKAHASCYHTHSAIDAALELIQRFDLRPEIIKNVTVRLYSGALNLLEKVEPTSPYAAKFSLPFCVATALVYRQVGIEAFSNKRLRDPEILELMPKIELRHNPELDRLYPERWPAVVEITLSSDQVIQTRVDYPKGDPHNPMSREELVEKFHQLTEKALPSKKRNRLVEACYHLQGVPNLAAFFE